MSFVIFRDEEGDSIAIDPSRIVMIESLGIMNAGLSRIVFQLGYRGEVEDRVVRHEVVEIVEALNKVDPFG